MRVNEQNKKNGRVYELVCLCVSVYACKTESERVGVSVVWVRQWER